MCSEKSKLLHNQHINLPLILLGRSPYPDNIKQEIAGTRSSMSIVAGSKWRVSLVPVLIIHIVQVLFRLRSGFGTLLIRNCRFSCGLPRYSHVTFRYRVRRVIINFRLEEKENCLLTGPRLEMNKEA